MEAHGWILLLFFVWTVLVLNIDGDMALTSCKKKQVWNLSHHVSNMQLVNKLTVTLSSIIRLLYISFMHSLDHVDAQCMCHMLAQEEHRNCLCVDLMLWAVVWFSSWNWTLQKLSWAPTDAIYRVGAGRQICTAVVLCGCSPYGYCRPKWHHDHQTLW